MLIQSHIFDHYTHAKTAVAQLERAGIKSSAVSIMGRGGEDLGSLSLFSATDLAPARTNGSLLDAMGLMCIEGVGPLAVAGSLPSLVAQTGTTGNDLLMALMTLGHKRMDAEILAEAVHRGATLVSVMIDEGRVGGVSAILEDNGGVAPEDRGSAYRDEGWTHYDAKMPPFTSEQVYQERMRYEEAA